MSKLKLMGLLGAVTLLSTSLVYAESIIIPMSLVSETGQEGKSIGTIEAQNAACGVLLTPNLHDLPPGVHGFHIHINHSCADKGMAAGGHLDPKDTGEHKGPYEKGHLGDLPVLVVDKDGKATLPTLAPRFTLEEMKGHSLMIHAGGDNYSDKPEKLGGGGERIACGLIQ